MPLCVKLMVGFAAVELLIVTPVFGDTPQLCEIIPTGVDKLVKFTVKGVAELVHVSRLLIVKLAFALGKSPTKILSFLVVVPHSFVAETQY